MSAPMRAVSVLVLAWVGSGPAWAVDPPKTVVPREGCVTAECHPGVKDHQHLHGPVYVNACDSCHTLTDAATHRYEFSRGLDETCVFCHVVETPPGEHVHAPVEAGRCLACHDPHGGPVPQLLRGDRYADSCKACHEDVTAGHTSVHGPASAGACGACHLPHSSSHPKLLVEEGRRLCLRCHVTTGIEIDTMPVKHEPAQADCLVCHDPHATDTMAVLTQEPVELCTGCHTDIAHTIDTATSQHEAVTADRSCLNCHEAHAGTHPVLLQDDPATLCFECHDRVIEMPDGSKLPDMKALIETGKSLHGPVAERDCAACHDIHGGGHRRLLTNEYPTQVYYPFSESAYALCFSCHDKQAVLLERSASVTGFRNGDLNLHFVHVNRDEKGRTCSVCHDAHASDRDKIIRDSVPFGPAGWELPIGYTKLDTGGRCDTGCHRPYTYDRVTPQAYPSREEGAQEWRGDDLVPGVPAESARRPGAGRKP